MKILATLLAATLLGGCATTCNTMTLKDGETCSTYSYGRSSTQFWMRASSYESGIIEPTGWDITL